MKHIHIATNDKNDETKLHCKVCNAPIGSIKKLWVSDDTWAWTVIRSPVNENEDINYNSMVTVKFVKVESHNQCSKT